MLDGRPRGGRVNTAPAPGSPRRGLCAVGWSGGERRERSVDAPEHGRMLLRRSDPRQFRIALRTSASTKHGITELCFIEHLGRGGTNRLEAAPACGIVRLTFAFHDA